MQGAPTYPYPSSRWRRKKKKEVRKRMLKMGNKDLFLWDLNDVLKSLPDRSLAENVAATVYSKASRVGIDEAVAYVDSMRKQDGLDEESANRIHDLLMRNSVRR